MSSPYHPDDTNVALDLQAHEDMLLAMRLQEQEQQAAAASQHPAETMLYVACELDGRFVQLFVDSGASMSAISSCMVKQLGLERKVNNRVRGSASGVGSANIQGLLENVACTIGHVEFRLTFMVLDSPRPILLLGLDQLRRYKCLIDLDSNVLVFGGKNGVEVPFLAADLTESAPLSNTESHKRRSRSMFGSIFGKR